MIFLVIFSNISFTFFFFGYINKHFFRGSPRPPMSVSVMQRSMPQEVFEGQETNEEKEERRKKRKLERKRERKRERRRREETGMLVTKRAAWGSGSGVSTGTLAFVEGTTRRRSGGQKKGDGNSSSLPRLHWRQEEREKKEIVSRTSVLGQFSWRKRVDNLLAKYHY